MYMTIVTMTNTYVSYHKLCSMQSLLLLLLLLHYHCYYLRYEYDTDYYWCIGFYLFLLSCQWTLIRLLFSETILIITLMIIMIIVTPASIFGMNLKSGLEHDHPSFVIVTVMGLLSSVAILIIMLAYMRKKRLL